MKERFWFNSNARGYSPKFYFSEKEIDFTSVTLNYKQFLLQEFFTADFKTRNKISNFYIKEYGERSYAYLDRKYSEWANGDYHLTDYMEDRITSVMPKFLSKEAKHKIGIHEFMATIKNGVMSFENGQRGEYKNSSDVKPQEVISIFEQEYSRIQNLRTQEFKFNILKEEEKEQALMICKYILEIKLEKDFNRVEKDFRTFLPFMSKFKKDVFSAYYFITSINSRVKITNTSIDEIAFTKFKINESAINSKFKEYSDKYLAYELVSINRKSNNSICKSFLNANDLGVFLLQYEELSKGENEVKMNAKFQGEGGVLTLEAEFKPIKLLKRLIVQSSLFSIIAIVALTILVFLALNISATFSILGSIMFGFPLLGYVIEELRKIQSFIKQYKTNGRQ